MSYKTDDGETPIASAETGDNQLTFQNNLAFWAALFLSDGWRD